MYIKLNGEQHPINEALSIAQLIEDLGLANKRLAVEVNGEIIPRSQHPEHQINEADNVEIVHAIGGG